MAHAQKPDFAFRRNGRVHLKRRGTSVQSTAGSRGVRISGNNAGYTMFRGSVKGTGYPLHSPVSPSLPLRCVTVCHHISTGAYQICLPPHLHFFVTDLRHKSWKWISVLFYPGKNKIFVITHSSHVRICWFCVWEKEVSNFLLSRNHTGDV